MCHRVVGFTFRGLLSVTSPLRGQANLVSLYKPSPDQTHIFQLALKYMF